MEGSPWPVPVAGDFNVSDRQPFYRELRGRFADAYRDAGWVRLHVPQRLLPRRTAGTAVRLDYILRDERWSVVAARTGPCLLDHRFLLADLVLR